MTEDDLLGRVIDFAVLHRWRVHHSRPARTARGWRTPVQGHRGLPDLVLARGGRVILAELKSETGQLAADQIQWRSAIGPGMWRLWRPSDWPDIKETLSGAPGGTQ